MTDAYTRINKPTDATYTSVNEEGKQVYDQYDVKYDESTVYYDGVNPNAYTSVSRPNDSTYTTIAKPTT